MPLLIVGTHNPKKRLELLEILGGDGVELRDLSAYPDAPEVVEDGATFEANARKKAVELARYLNAWTISDDSGLVVPGLGGRPGVYSARYAGEPPNDDANNARLQAELKPLPADRRTAYYVCVIAVADPTGEVRGTAEGHCHGVITAEARGTGGFGYDPYFLIPEYHKTFGELSPRVKHAISHRARALERLRPLLLRSLNGAGS